MDNYTITELDYTSSSSTTSYSQLSAEDGAILNLIKRICLDRTNYVNPEFGSDENSLYIDGGVNYADETEKELLLNWLLKIREEVK